MLPTLILVQGGLEHRPHPCLISSSAHQAKSFQVNRTIFSDVGGLRTVRKVARWVVVVYWLLDQADGLGFRYNVARQQGTTYRADGQVTGLRRPMFRLRTGRYGRRP